MKGKTLTWIGIVLSLISGVEAIVRFINTLSKDLQNLWISLPPLLQLIVAFGLVYLLIKILNKEK
ncbi:MAG: hypothetical protein ABIJ20_01120 [Nanoarchaeota archaeon]|nr:hypothetical protein [Nanoarchaeota archaeon]MBU1445234.1 hypothetical protein [Nanoarchaeota archaeon]MBU2420394.1 hypothetical protein [Nanoarchaeota archaeon]MBU2475172.1 hypothetical protein [Nanoarchaeota archaeon]